MLEELEELFEEIKTTSKEVRLNTADQVLIKRSTEFEPWGRATEDFEEVWYVEIPNIQYYWKSTKWEIWTRGNEGLHMTFRGRTLNDAILKAIATLREDFFTEKKIDASKTH